MQFWQFIKPAPLLDLDLFPEIKPILSFYLSDCYFFLLISISRHFVIIILSSPPLLF